MPARPAPLPPELADRAFTLAEGLDAGVGIGRMRGSDLFRPTAGVRSASPCPDLRSLAAATALGLPRGTAFSHATAALLLGLPVPWAVARAPGPLDVMRETDAAPIRRRGCRFHRGLERRRVIEVGGLLVTSPIDTWLDLAVCWGRTDLVVLGDAIVAAGWASPQVLRARAEAGRGRRGIRTARAAGDLVRVGSASPQESRCRCLFVDEGLPEPRLNVELRDPYGFHVATVDFLWRESKVVGEYDGDQHRTDRRAWRYDRARRARIEDLGWTYVEMDGDSLRPGPVQDALLARLRRLLL